MPLQIPLRVSLRQLYVGDTFDTVYVRQSMCVGAAQCEKNCQDCVGPGVAIKMHQLGPGFVQQVQVRAWGCPGSMVKLRSLVGRGGGGRGGGRSRVHHGLHAEIL